MRAFTPNRFVLACALACASLAQASIRTPVAESGSSRDGTESELWLSVLDRTGEQAYTLDLGITIAQIRATNTDLGNLSALSTSGSNVAATFLKAADSTRDYAFWIIDGRTDEAWRQFRLAVGSNLGDATWGVMGVDATGANSAGNKGFVMTITDGGQELIRGMKNSNVLGLQGANGATSFVPILNGATGSTSNSFLQGLPVGTDPGSEAAALINGASYDTKAANPDGYFAQVADSFANASLPMMTNAIGQSAWFYDLTRSSSSANALVTVNEFDNLAGDAYWGFAAEVGTNGQPTDRYLLSYVLPRYLSTTEVAQGVTFDNNFARLAGILSLVNPVGQDETVVSLTEGFLHRLAQRSQAARVTDGLQTIQAIRGGDMAIATSVPEPSSWLLMALGGAGLLAWHRRRQAGQPCAA